MTELQLFSNARAHGNSVAFRSESAEYTYSNLLDCSRQLAIELCRDSEDLHEARVAFLMPSGFDYAVVQWAIWRAGGVAVPLSLSATDPEREYVVLDSEAKCVITTWDLVDKVKRLCDHHNLRLVDVSEFPTGVNGTLPVLDSNRRAMILYTSGTTSKPKGVVTTHANVQSQIEALVDAWHWDPNDRIPLFLPLHHIHGIINVLSCALWAGAAIESFPNFEMKQIMNRVAAKAFTVFMAVPTIYVKMIQWLSSRTELDRASVVQGFASMRLMVSGSAALPASVHKEWTELTGQRLLERYGMTEIGMALSNPYDAERRPGTVGKPLPDVEIMLRSESGELSLSEGQPGEIIIQGPSVFLEYWGQPQVTADSFENDWFRTGDVAVLEDGYFRIMGRQSVDIIKSGGYKLSALEIEATLVQHPSIRECAVVGVTDETWGEAVAAVAVIEHDQELVLEELRTWCRDQMSAYKIPKRLLVVESLPRNAMGKITKPAVVQLFE